MFLMFPGKHAPRPSTLLCTKKQLYPTKRGKKTYQLERIIAKKIIFSKKMECLLLLMELQPVPGSKMVVKSRSVKSNAKNARGLGRDRAAEPVSIFPTATASFPKSRASYFRFARFNTSPLYYLRAWHRLMELKLSPCNYWGSFIWLLQVTYLVFSVTKSHKKIPVMALGVIYCLAMMFAQCRGCRIDLVTVFYAILTRGQTCEKLQCLYENLMSNNYRKTAVLKKISIVN